MSALLLPMRQSSYAPGALVSYAALPCFSRRRVAARLGRRTLCRVVL